MQLFEALMLTSYWPARAPGGSWTPAAWAAAGPSAGTPTTASRAPSTCGACPATITWRNIPSHVSLGAGTALNNANPASLDFTLVNKSLPWDYDFRFVIEEISNIDDKAQV